MNAETSFLRVNTFFYLTRDEAKFASMSEEKVETTEVADGGASTEIADSGTVTKMTVKWCERTCFSMWCELNDANDGKLTTRRALTDLCKSVARVV